MATPTRQPPKPSRTPLTPEQRTQLKKQVMFEREQSELSPIPIPDEALPQVKAGLPQCFYCGLFGHWFRECPDRRAFLPSYGAPPQHWRKLENGQHYDVNVIWPSILEADFAQMSPSQITVTRAIKAETEVDELDSIASDEAFYDAAFEGIPPQESIKAANDPPPPVDRLSQYESAVFAAYEAAAAEAATKHLARLKKPDANDSGGVGKEHEFALPSVEMTSSSIVVTFASPTFRTSKDVGTQTTDVGTQTDTYTEDQPSL
ncbi:hypothetical protein DFH28DRAFT_1129206 [Melampsora americana]|nr:hypothetical protein DFH28DRAFT_1129206 [Melampsora americana]